jgi:Tfp pilus tip-associated adhesin PilY1
MGQTWSIPAVAPVKGFSADADTPVIVVGGGYDPCEDQDAAPNTACTVTTPTAYTRRGNRVYVIDANTGALIREFATNGSVAADITLVDRDFDGFVDHAYAATTTGRIYRIDFVDPTSVSTTRAKENWTISEVGHTAGANRKFLFSPAALASTGKIFLTLASGDRERPLIVNYPFSNPVTNRAYMLIDKFEVRTNPSDGVVTGTPVDMDSSSMANFTSSTSCSEGSPEASGKKGWFFDLTAGTGEQGVTSSAIFGGLVFFSTNRPLPTPPGACARDLGEARGYAVNVLTASGAVGAAGIVCGGERSGVFTGGGLPPSPVTGTVPVDGQPVTVCIGCIDRPTGTGSPINPGQIKPSITQKRSRLYWYKQGDQ